METIPVVLDDGCSRTDKFPSLLALSANQTPDWTINSVSTAFNELSLALVVYVVALVFFLHCSKRTPVAATSWLIVPTKPHTVLATHPNPHTPTHTHTWGKSERQPGSRGRMADRDDCCGQLTVSLVGLHGRLPVVQEVPVSVACLFALYCHVVQDIGWFLQPLPPPPHGLTG